MIRNILFDWGGVLIEDPGPGVRDYCARALGIHRDMMKSELWHTAMLRFQVGAVEESRMWEELCAAWGVRAPGKRSIWTEAFYAVYREQAETLRLARQLLMQGYRVGLLSNTELPTVAFLRKEHGAAYEFFEAQIFSCEEKTAKPDAAIFRRALARLNAAAAETVFFDDRADFVAGAQAAGLYARQFTTAAQARNDLNEWGITVYT